MLTVVEKNKTNNFLENRNVFSHTSVDYKFKISLSKVGFLLEVLKENLSHASLLDSGD